MRGPAAVTTLLFTSVVAWGGIAFRGPLPEFSGERAMFDAQARVSVSEQETKVELWFPFAPAWTLDPFDHIGLTFPVADFLFLAGGEPQFGIALARRGQIAAGVVYQIESRQAMLNIWEASGGYPPVWMRPGPGLTPVGQAMIQAGPPGGIGGIPGMQVTVVFATPRELFDLYLMGSLSFQFAAAGRGGGILTGDVRPDPTPEPATVLLVLAGLAGLRSLSKPAPPNRR
ncbi:MAG: hypothetical protein K2X35_19490 [Bryobacteraceae bacterium]|nr:hypothetical protein [Bryobacteraceae bacterium]